MAKTSSRASGSYPPKKHSLKFILGTIAVLFMVVGLVVAAVMASMNQDLRQQASDGYTSVRCTSYENPTSGSANSHECYRNGKLTRECNSGYSLNGSGSCASQVDLSKQYPACPVGANFSETSVNNGSACWGSTYNYNKVLYVCNSGYHLSNLNPQSCVKDGPVTVYPACDSKKMGFVGDYPNSHRCTYPDDGATHPFSQCNSGYDLDGYTCKKTSQPILQQPRR